MEVHRSLDDFRGDARLSTWIYRVAVNKSLDFIRKKKRKKRFGFLQSIGTTDEDSSEIQIPDEATPEDELEKKERSRILRQAVNKLSDSQQVAVTLSKYEGRSYKEIAGIMGTTIPSVESLIHRGMKNLRKHLTYYYENIHG